MSTICLHLEKPLKSMERETREFLPIFYRLKIVGKLSDSDNIQIAHNKAGSGKLLSRYTIQAAHSIYRFPYQEN